MEADGSFTRFEFGSSALSGKNFFDYADRLARQGVLAPEGSRERAQGQDFLWFLWCGRNSPVFGRDHIATFERALIEDKSTWKEPKNAYYEHNESEACCAKILEMFGLDKPWSRIVNGHIPVKVKDGESPLRAGGKLVVIDGGFCKAYQRETGIAGYTMFFSSHGIRLSAHEPFAAARDALTRGSDILSHTVRVEDFLQRVMVADIDTGAAIRERIDELLKLLDAYRDGVITAK
jgi:fructose-1,6-bisphosphatase-3